MNIMRNDKVILTKAMGNLQVVGETFEVANVTETAVVLRNAKNKVAVGAVDIAMFDQYFKKPEEVKGWTPWQRLVDHLGNTMAFYRTNLKKVQVRSADSTSATRGEATCNKCDEFNLHFGINIAMRRCRIKALKRLVADYEDAMKHFSNEISTEESAIERMIKNLVSNESDK